MAEGAGPAVRLPAWTWLAPVLLGALGALSTSRLEPGGPDLGPWYWPTAVGVVLVHWWGPRVLPGFLLGELACAAAAGLEAGWAWLLVGLPETLLLATSWWLFARLWGGRCWLPDKAHLVAFLPLGLLIPSLLAGLLAASRTVLLGTVPAGGFSDLVWAWTLSDTLAAASVAVPLLRFATAPLAQRGLARVTGAVPVPFVPAGRRPLLVVGELTGLALASLAFALAGGLGPAWFLFGLVVLWAAIRFGVDAAIVMNAWVVSVAVLMPALHGQPSGIWATDHQTLHLYSDLVVLCLAGLVVGQVVSELSAEVAQRARAEAALGRSEALLQAALRESPAGIVIADAPDVRLRLANPAALGIRGGRRAELLDIDVTEHVQRWQVLSTDGSVVDPHHLPLTRAVKAGETTHEKELVIVDADGHERWIAVSAAPIHDDHGQIVAGIAVFPDITDRKRAEWALAESERIHRDFIATSPIGIFSCRIEPPLALDRPLAEQVEGILVRGRVEIANHALASLWHEPAENLLAGQPLAALFADGAQARDVVLRFVSNSYRLEAIDLPRSGPGADGAWCQVHLAAVVEQGRLVRIWGTLLDITIRKRAEAERATYRERLEEEVASRTHELVLARQSAEAERALAERLIASLPGLCFLVDSDGLHRRWNQNHLAASGRTPAMLAQTRLVDLFPDDRALVADFLDQAQHRGQAQVEARLVTCDGARQVLLTGARVTTASGSAVIGTGLDLTERLAVEDELRRLSRVVEQSPAAILIADLAGSVVYANPAITGITGYRPVALRGQALGPMLGFEVGREPWTEPGSEDVWRGEVEHHQADGSRCWCLLTVAPIRDRSGTVSHLLAILEDISAQRLLQAELVAAKEFAEQSAQAKSAFLANMSHEIRTPMNAVLGFLDLVLGAENVTPAARDALRTARRAAGQLLVLIDDILDVSKLDAGKLQLVHEPFDLAETVASALKPLRSLADQKSLALVLDPVPGERLLGDAARLRQILVNLVGNAIKFTEAGSVRVSVGKEAAGWRFAITDTGIGIAPEHLSRIFEPFTQADQSTGRRFGGTGLGTTISRELVELMGGRIWAESELGVGSTFTFVVPFKASVEDNPPGSGSGTNRHRVDPASRRLRILLAEDVAENVRLVELWCRRWGHDLVSVGDGAAALEALAAASGSFDVVLMDIHMPVLDGETATRRLRDGGDTTPVIALTASMMPEEQARYRAAGIDEVVGKPIDFHHLGEVMQHLAATGPPPSRQHQGPVGAPMRGLVDLAAGRRRWRDEEAYMAALASFAANQSSIDRIAVLLDQGARDQARARAHAIKGLAANLALAAVSAAAGQLEEALGQADQDPAGPAWDLIAAFATTRAQILALQPQPPRCPPVGEPIDRGEARRRALHLQGLCKRGELDEAALSALYGARPHLPGLLLERLDAALQSYDFSRASRALDAIIQALSDQSPTPTTNQR